MMIRCSFCHHDNEDGALFCERCTSDLNLTPQASAIPAHSLEKSVPVRPVQSDAGLDDLPLVHAEPAGPGTEVPLESGQQPLEIAEHQAGTGAASPNPEAVRLGQDSQPRLLVLRGLKRNLEYPLYEGLNFIGRADEKPVDIDLEEQEPPDRIWTSRQHACINFEAGQLLLEDLNSANGTYVNRMRVYPGQKHPLAVNDIIQIGNVQLRVLA